MKLSAQIGNSTNTTIPPYKQDVELEIENIFDVEKQISIPDQIEIFNIQLQIDKIITRTTLTPLDEARLFCFEQRIEDIYTKLEPTTKEFIQVELLMLGII